MVRQYKDVHIAAVRERAERRVAEHRRRLTAHLRAHPCVDCGETDLRVLDVCRDRAEISGMVHAVSWRRLRQGIDLCDVRCSDCHRRRTAEELGYWCANRPYRRPRPGGLTAISTLLEEVFDDLEDADDEHALGGVHALVRDGDELRVRALGARRR